MHAFNLTKKWNSIVAPLSLSILSLALSGCGNGSSPVKVDTSTGSTTGSRIIFNGIVAPTVGFYTVLADGTGAKHITTGTKGEVSPSISPDSKRIVFAGTSSPAGFYLANIDGSNATAWPATTAFASAFTPVYGPSGSRVVLVGDRNLFTAPDNGLSTTRVTNFPTGDINNPSFSPDLKKILFTRKDSATAQFVCTINANGTIPLTLTPAASLNYYPRFSPDGNSIIFISNRDGNNQVYIMKADGSAQTRLSNTTSNEINPVLSPDGKKIAFYSDRESPGVLKVYTMNIDGSNQTKLSDIQGDGISLDWR